MSCEVRRPHLLAWAASFFRRNPCRTMLSLQTTPKRWPLMIERSQRSSVSQTKARLLWRMDLNRQDFQASIQDTEEMLSELRDKYIRGTSPLSAHLWQWIGNSERKLVCSGGRATDFRAFTKRCDCNFVLLTTRQSKQRFARRLSRRQLRDQ